ncbi:SRPBCC family protein [Nocardia takedensis]|uniref:SRPBCC family protein n=1 Tax=Nocardia takedensis TaxID=259390 RepID=UPI0002E200D2|nr:SRPBCC family protein [Nocardia takedensis]
MALLTDPLAVAGLVTREVRSGSRAGDPTRIAVARRTYPTDRADLWAALTDPERIPRWFLPVSGDLRPGGRYSLEGNASGVVERCDAPESFAVTWEMGPQISWLTITLTPDGEGTRLELLHEAPVDPEFWTRYGPGAVGVGWDLALMGLGLHLASGEPVDPREGMEFATTVEGIAFVRASATGWAEAAAADGDDAIAAHTAAENTIVFYTTVPEAGDES